MPAMAVRQLRENSPDLFISAHQPELATAEPELSELAVPERPPQAQLEQEVAADTIDEADTNKIMAGLRRVERKCDLLYGVRMLGAAAVGLTSTFALIAHPPFGLQANTDLVTFLALMAGMIPIAAMGIWHIAKTATPLGIGTDRLEQIEGELGHKSGPRAVWNAAKQMSIPALYALQEDITRRLNRDQKDYAARLDQRKSHLHLLSQIGPCMIHNRSVLSSMGVHVPKAEWFLALLDLCEERSDGLESREIAEVRIKFEQVRGQQSQQDFLPDLTARAE
ncbi:MAG: hypothetical protein K1X83_01205 [Oligoflexia bacterium]|nr:hypothetical protein [Oligoflexia bacterium]